MDFLGEQNHLLTHTEQEYNFWLVEAGIANEYLQTLAEEFDNFLDNHFVQDTKAQKNYQTLKKEIDDLTIFIEGCLHEASFEKKYY